VYTDVVGSVYGIVVYDEPDMVAVVVMMSTALDQSPQVLDTGGRHQNPYTRSPPIHKDTRVGGPRKQHAGT